MCVFESDLNSQFVARSHSLSPCQYAAFSECFSHSNLPVCVCVFVVFYCSGTSVCRGGAPVLAFVIHLLCWASPALDQCSALTLAHRSVTEPLFSPPQSSLFHTNFGRGIARVRIRVLHMCFFEMNECACVIV